MTKVFPVLSLIGTTHAYFEKTSMMQSKYLCLSFNFDNFDKSAKSACHWVSIPATTVLRRKNSLPIGLCKVCQICLPLSINSSHYRFASQKLFTNRFM